MNLLLGFRTYAYFSLTLDLRINSVASMLFGLKVEVRLLVPKRATYLFIFLKTSTTQPVRNAL